MLIRSPNIRSKVEGQWVERCFWKNTPKGLTKEHYGFIAKIVNLLRPYYPQDVYTGKPAPRHILLALPMVMLSNFVLSSMGYQVSTRKRHLPLQDLTQRAMPEIATGKLWSLTLTDQSLYEIFCVNPKTVKKGTGCSSSNRSSDSK